MMRRPTQAEAPMKSVREHIRVAIERSGVTQEQVAEACGVSGPAVRTEGGRSDVRRRMASSRASNSGKANGLTR